MAIDPDERARPGRPPLVGFGRRNPVDGERGRGLGERAAVRDHSAPRDRSAARAAILVGGCRGGTRPTCRLRLLRLGWLWCLVCQLTTGGLPLPQRFIPEPWPELPVGVLVVAFHQSTFEYHAA